MHILGHSSGIISILLNCTQMGHTVILRLNSSKHGKVRIVL